jgi:hypothetical protein
VYDIDGQGEESLRGLVDGYCAVTFPALLRLDAADQSKTRWPNVYKITIPGSIEKKEEEGKHSSILLYRTVAQAYS